jgi:hypothetical protein
MRVVMVHHRRFHGHTPFTRHALLLMVAEAALVHTLRDRTEAAYQRGDLMEKRRRLMAEWGMFCSKALGKWRRRAPSGE